MSKNMKKVYFTTSWDDGSIHDLKLAALMEKYSIKGTFYIPKEFNTSGNKFSEYGRRLTEEEIQIISRAQEVGAHSLNHYNLTILNDEQLREEICGSKNFLEKIIGRKIKLFCPPQGFVNEKVIMVAREAGYGGLRTTENLNFFLPEDNFRIGVGIQCTPFPLRKKDTNHYNWKKLFDPVKSYGWTLVSFPSAIPYLYSWQSFARSFFRYSMANGNYFHLWGHSWELQKYQMWGELELFFKFVKEFNKVEFIFNSEIIDLKP